MRAAGQLKRIWFNDATSAGGMTSGVGIGPIYAPEYPRPGDLPGAIFELVRAIGHAILRRQVRIAYGVGARPNFVDGEAVIVQLWRRLAHATHMPAASVSSATR